MSGFIHTHGGADPQTAAPIVEIVSAGNEVLIGDVLDTNTNWLCTRVTGLGGLVRRTVMLRDDVTAIAAEGFSVAIKPGQYYWGSNSEVLNRALLLILAGVAGIFTGLSLRAWRERRKK